MSDDSHDFEGVNISIEVLTSDIEKMKDDISKLNTKDLKSEVSALIFQSGCIQNRLSIIEKQHSLFRKNIIDPELSERIDKLEIDIKSSPLFSKESVERAREAIAKRKAEIDKGYEKFKEEDARAKQDIQDEHNRFIKDTDEKMRKIGKSKEKDPEDDGNGDVPNF